MKELKKMKKLGAKSWVMRDVKSTKIEKTVAKLRKQYKFVEVWEHANSDRLDILVVF